MSSGLLSVYVTFASSEEAERIIARLLDEGLVACGNIETSVLSLYEWKGKMEREQECAASLKTTASVFEPLCARIDELHSYEVPCVIATELSHAHEAYAKWVREQVTWTAS